MSIFRAGLTAVGVAVLAVSSVACSDDAGTVETTSEQSASEQSASGQSASRQSAGDSVFRSTSVVGHDLLPGTTVTVSVAAEGSSVSFNAGCNTLLGSVDVAAGVVDMSGPMASTRMACTPELMDQDEWLQGFLGSGPGWAVDGDTLTITGPAVTLTAQKST